jgi:hypothetical protein
VGRAATGAPVISGWVWHGEAVGTALTGGVGNTVRPIRFSNRIKFISNGFKFAPNVDRSKRCLPQLQKFQMKYGWKELEIRNNFPYRNFSRFETEFEQEFRELLRVEIH